MKRRILAQMKGKNPKEFTTAQFGKKSRKSWYQAVQNPQIEELLLLMSQFRAILVATTAMAVKDLEKDCTILPQNLTKEMLQESTITRIMKGKMIPSTAIQIHRSTIILKKFY